MCVGVWNHEARSEIQKHLLAKDKEMALNYTTADAALKEFYLPAVRENLNNTNLLLAQIEKNTRDVEGRRAVLSLHVSRNSGVGSRAEGGTLPSAGAQGYAEERVPLKYHYARIEITGPVMRAMKTDSGSFTRAVDSEMKGAVNDLKRDINRQLFGTSDGVIVEVGSGSSTTDINFAATATATQKRQIEVGMLVDIGTSSPFTSVGTARTVTAVDDTKFVVTPALSGAPTSGDKVVRSGSGGSGAAQKELTGLQTIVDSTGALFNVNPSAYPVWSAYEDAPGTDRAATENLFAKVIHQVSIRSGLEVDAFVTTDGVHRAYAAQLTAEKRMVNTLDLKGGYKGLSITAGGGEKALTWDRDCPAQTAFGLSWDHLTLHTTGDWDWMDEDGAILSRVVGVDAYEATLFRDMELTTDRRNAHAKVANLIEA